jgi:hypothetical protein
MAEKRQFGDIAQVTVHDEARRAVISFNATGGDLPLGFKTLEPTNNNDDAYNAMLAIATLGLQYGAPGQSQHVHVRYDDAGSEPHELKEISIHQ